MIRPGEDGGRGAAAGAPPALTAGKTGVTHSITNPVTAGGGGAAAGAPALTAGSESLAGSIRSPMHAISET